jgi:hypothetical protein
MAELVELTNSIRVLADRAAARVAEMTAELETATTQRERKAIRKRRALMRDVERFARSRVGYR